MRRNADAQPTSSCGCPCATLRPATPNTGWDYGGTSYLQLACSVADWSSSSSSSSRSRSRSSKHHEATASSSNTLLPHLIEASFCCVCNTTTAVDKQHHTEKKRERPIVMFCDFVTFVTFCRDHAIFRKWLPQRPSICCIHIWTLLGLFLQRVMDVCPRD